VIVLSRFDLRDEVASVRDIGNDGVLKLTNLRFISIATIEEEDFIPTLFDQLINFVWLEMLAAVDDALFIYLDINWQAKIDELFFDLHFEAREVIARSLRPLEIDLLETWVLLGGADIFLEIGHISAEGSIDSMLGDQHATLEI